jgi:glucose-1-phosphate cytidylyltransferase
MQVVILCGGQGTRIREVADDIPKPMVPVGGRPILWHIMKHFDHYRLEHFVLCLGYKSHVIKSYFLNYPLNEADFTISLTGAGRVEVHDPPPREAWRVTLAETGLQAMTGCRLKRIEKYIEGDTFLLTYGDGVADVDINALLRFHKRHGRLATVTAVRPPGRFGEMEVRGADVVEFNEKRSTAQGWINGGFFVLDRRVFSYLEDSPDLMFEQGPLTSLARDGQLAAYRHHGFWQPMDTYRDHKYLNDLWDAGNAAWAVWQPRSWLRAA